MNLLLQNFNPAFISANRSSYNNMTSATSDNDRDILCKPVTQYTKAGPVNIAYQVFGSGPVDLVYIPGWISNIDWMWACPELVAFFQELGKMARVILFDKRGTGLSDRVTDFATLEERMEDIKQVMDAVNSKEAVLFGHSEGGSVSMLFAATFPERVISLMTFGVFAKRRYDEDYPWAPTDEERQRLYDMIRDSWGTDQMEIDNLAPSKADDPVFMNWLSGYFRFGASPSAALTLTKLNTQVNIVGILGAVRVPVLIMQRNRDIDVRIDEGKYMASMIRNARFVEFNGEDHLFWIGNTEEVLDEMRNFIRQNKKEVSKDKRLVTVLSGRFSDLSNAESAFKLAERMTREYSGDYEVTDNDRWRAIFRGPGSAMDCAVRLSEQFSLLETDLSQAIYMTNDLIESENNRSTEREGMSTEILKLAMPGQLLVTDTVKHLLSGTEVDYTRIGSVYDRVFELIKDIMLVNGTVDHTNDMQNHPNPRREVLLDRVISVIEEHLEDESFNIKKLSQETGISDRQLQRKIKSLTDKSPNQLITSIRLNSARKLLFLQQYSVSEIAFMTGFSSPSYFSKCFKKEFGISPTTLLS